MTITQARGSRRTRSALSKASVTCAAALAAAAGVGALHPGAARANHVPYEIDRLGFDTDHTFTANGATRRVFSGVKVNDANIVIGNQERHTGGGSLATGQTAWTFQNDQMIRVGLTDADQGQGGYISTATGAPQSSTAMYFNLGGLVTGESERYLGSATAGRAAWLYENGTSNRIGLYQDAVFRRSTTDKYELSDVVGMSDSGHVVGDSQRYLNGNTNGTSAWLHSPGSASSANIDPASLGADPTGAVYTGTNGLKQSQSLFVTSTVTGDVTVAGTSKRYGAAGVGLGDATWVYTNGAHTRVGLTGDHYTGSTGVQSSTIVALNKAGGVAGTSKRYPAEGTGDRGQMAFLRSPGGESNAIGLDDAEHTLGNSTNRNDDSYRFSDVTKLNDSGVAIGHSYRYVGTTQKGQSGWIASGTSPARIGLFNAPEFTGNGTQFTQVQRLSDNGHAAGYSSRYTPGGVDRGRAAWVYDAANGGTKRVGFVDSRHTRTDTDKPDYQFSEVLALNNSGRAVGRSLRYEGSAARGASAFFHSPTLLEPVRIGLFQDDGVHLAPDKLTQDSTPEFLNDAGDAAGYSSRYDQTSGAFEGFSGWFYGNVAGDGGAAPTSHPLVFSTRDDGLAFTDLSFLTDSGIVGGQYTLYSGNTLVGDRAFIWDSNVADPAARFHDLGTVTGATISPGEWDALTTAAGMTDLNAILGTGRWSDGGNSYYLVSAVPEPTGLALIAMTGLALLPRRRRR